MSDSTITLKQAWRKKDRPNVGDMVTITKTGRAKKVYHYPTPDITLYGYYESK